MNLLVAWKKVLLFGLFGAVGCLAGWAVGEAYLAIARAATDSASSAPSLISQPTTTTTAPPPSDTFKQRLDAAGAKSGDVQISLVWYNENDLDLHCIDPNNDEISFRHRTSRSGGMLDVDANRGGTGNPITAKPVENIFWPANGAPRGHYRVYVNHYNWRQDRAPNETTFDVSILRGNERTEFSNLTIKNRGGSPDDNRQLIFEFNLVPKVEVFATDKITLHQGETLRVPLAVRRTFIQGKLDVTAENLPEGVTATKATVPEGKDVAELELKATRSASDLKKSIKFIATGPDVTGFSDSELTVQAPTFSLTTVIIIGFWTALLAVGLCLALLVGQNRYLGRPLFASGRVPLALLIGGAILAGFVSGSVGQTLFSVFLSIGVGSLGLVVGWILLGGLLGLGISYFVPNLDRQKAGLAGLVGGFLGVIGYLVWSYASEWLGRFAGAALLGFCIGLMVAIVEAAFRRTWLEVRYGERETIAVNLGPEPVKIGGDAHACTVWARGAANVALRYFVRNSQVICEDAPTRRESVVGDGDVRTVGTVTVTVRTGAGAAPSGALPARVSAPPVLPRPSVPVPIPSPVAAPLSLDPQPMPVSQTPAPLSLDPEPQPAPRPAPPPPPPAVKPLAVDDDDPLPIPMSSAPPARPKVASILDDGYSSPPARPTAPAPVPRSAAPVPPTSAKPPLPPGSVPPKAPVPTAAATPSKPPVPAPVAKAPTATPVVPPKAAIPPAPPRPPVPGVAAKLPPAPPSKPASPVAAPKPPSSPEPASGAPKPGGDADACPTCGRKSPGRPGARFCMLCEKAY